MKLKSTSSLTLSGNLSKLFSTSQMLVGAFAIAHEYHMERKKKRQQDERLWKVQIPLE